jgi:hypothetical protein
MISVIFKSKMPSIMTMTGRSFRLPASALIIGLVFISVSCLGDNSAGKGSQSITGMADSTNSAEASDEIQPVNAMLVSPENPFSGEPFRILSAGGKNIRKARVIVTGPTGSLESLKSQTGGELPHWRIDDFAGTAAGKYRADIIDDRNVAGSIEFDISQNKPIPISGITWKNRRGWDSGFENLYSAWINILFYGCAEEASWKALHEVTQNQDQNFLYNYLSLDEDNPEGKNSVIMQPDCADNPFYLRAYFAWKLGLPFGFHLCDRGYLGRSPRTGQWITNESATSKTQPVQAFNSFLRRVADGVHSGTARTALDDENSDYYPVGLKEWTLRPGTVYADPYGHTLVLVGRVPQARNKPGLLLSVDAQPDGTVGIKRFWKGNFLFNTSEVIGEPGFKAFRPIEMRKGGLHVIGNKELTEATGFIPYSLQQRKMESDVFYHTIERIINTKPLDPETALAELIQALYEQLQVRVTSVSNGEAYFKSHPGTSVPMPSGTSGIFQAGGQWEDFSTPNRDLRLLIAIDAVTGFPDRVMRSPEDFDISGLSSPEQVNKKLQLILDRKVSELSITYTRTDGSLKKLTIGEILKRKDAFEMAYNPNDCIEVRWGAPENSEERATCRRHAPPYQIEKMRSVRGWFQKRLHPPT